jgi:transposase
LLDESGQSEKPSVRRTWALRGRTPILKHAFNWKRVAMSGALAVSPDRKRIRLFLSTKPGSVNSASVIGFLRSLRRHLRGPVIVVWDGLPAHRSREVHAYRAANRHWLHVERLPAYCPELNPLEYLWENLQANELANLAPQGLDDLERQIARGSRRIRRKPHLARSFFKHAGLSL